jgi:hypothetical protein
MLICQDMIGEILCGSNPRVTRLERKADLALSRNLHHLPLSCTKMRKTEDGQGWGRGLALRAVCQLPIAGVRPLCDSIRYRDMLPDGMARVGRTSANSLSLGSVVFGSLLRIAFTCLPYCICLCRCGTLHGLCSLTVCLCLFCLRRMVCPCCTVPCGPATLTLCVAFWTGAPSGVTPGPSLPAALVESPPFTWQHCWKTTG